MDWKAKWFKRKVEEPLPPAPCGNSNEHYYWTEATERTSACPICARQLRDEAQEAQLQHEASVYAKAIVDEMVKRGVIC